MEQRLEKLEENVSRIETNHLHHIQSDITHIKEVVAGLVADMGWLKKFFWAFMTPAIIVILGAVLALVVKG